MVALLLEIEATCPLKKKKNVSRSVYTPDIRNVLFYIQLEYGFESQNSVNQLVECKLMSLTTYSD